MEGLNDKGKYKKFDCLFRNKIKAEISEQPILENLIKSKIKIGFNRLLNN